MKADIPDKILISRGEDGRIHHSYWTTDKELVPFENTIYIRKDALLDWLKECKENPVITDLQRGNIQEIIEKIESL